MSAQMQSLYSSVGSKSIDDTRILYRPDHYDDQDESVAALRSSWIRRLCPNLPFHGSHPSQLTSPSTDASAAAVLPSGCAMGSSDQDNPPIFVGHHRTVSTVKSHSQTSNPNLQSEFVSRHPLNFHTGRSFAGFGPFKVGLQGPSAHHRNLNSKEAVLSQQAATLNFEGIRNLVFNGKYSEAASATLNSTTYGNSHGFSQRKEEEDKINAGLGQLGWLPRGQNLVNDSHGMRSFPHRMAGNDRHGSFHISPFSFPTPTPLQDSITKNREHQRKRWVGESSSRIEESDPTSLRSLKHLPRMIDDTGFSSKSGFLQGAHDLIYDARDRRMHEQPRPVDPWHSSAATHGNKHNSTSDPPPVHKSTILRRPERPAPACPDEPEEPSSYCNMGRMSRSITTSSAFSAFPVVGSSSRKRISDTYDLLYLKSRRLGVED